MEIFTPNSKPNERFFAVCEVSLNASISSQVGYFTATRDLMLKEFEGSKAISEYFDDPQFIDWCMIICLYHTADDKEIRRRIVRTQMPPNSDILLDIIMGVTDQLGVKINFHNVKVGSTTIKSMTGKSIKEKDFFLYNLIEFHQGAVAEPFKQLDTIKEEILKRSSLEGIPEGPTIGNFLQTYLQTKDNYYKIATNFGTQLAKADLKLATNLIPFSISSSFIEFPFQFKFSDFYIRNAFIAIASIRDDFSKGMTLICPKYRDGIWDGTYFETTLKIENSKNIEESLKENAKFFYDKEVVQLSDIKVYKDLIDYALKCLIYIHSSDPDLEIEKGAESKKKNLSKTKSFFKHNNPFPIINVGFGFHGRQSSGLAVHVSGHFRWQPCGPALSQVKLIWIEDYVKPGKSENIFELK